MNLSIFDKKGKKTDKKIKLDASVFGLDIDESLLSQAVYVFRQNQRQSNAHTKDRSEVRGGGRKPWRQKGTGRARHGSTRSPIWVGGGVTFGPTNLRNYKKKLNKKQRKLALRHSLSQRAKSKDILVVEGFDFKKSKDVEKFLKALKLDSATLIHQDEEVYKSAKNIKEVSVVRVGELNVFNILSSKKLILSKEALNKIHETWAESSKK